jgi:hypothetical protein
VTRAQRWHGRGVNHHHATEIGLAHHASFIPPTPSTPVCRTEGQIIPERMEVAFCLISISLSSSGFLTLFCFFLCPAFFLILTVQNVPHSLSLGYLFYLSYFLFLLLFHESMYFTCIFYFPLSLSLSPSVCLSLSSSSLCINLSLYH